MPCTVEIEGLAELQAQWAREIGTLEKDLKGAAVLAAHEGVDAAKRTHPYTDRTYQLTDTARVEPRQDGAAMVWPKKYASFVDKGTSRAKAYPFGIVAVVAAGAALKDLAEDALKRFAHRMRTGF